MSKFIYFLMQNPELAMDMLNENNNSIWLENEIERLAIINAFTEDSIKSAPFWQ